MKPARQDKDDEDVVSSGSDTETESEEDEDTVSVNWLDDYNDDSTGSNCPKDTMDEYE